MSNRKYEFQEPKITTKPKKENIKDQEKAKTRKIRIKNRVHKHLDLSKTISHDDTIVSNSKEITSVLADESFQRDLESKIITNNKVTNTFKYFQIFFIIALSLGILAVMSQKNLKMINRLQNENEKLRLELVNLEIRQNKKISDSKDLTDFADIGQEPFIDYTNTSKPLRFGFFFRRSSYPAEFVFLQNSVIGNCFCFEKCGTISIVFKKRIKMKSLGLFYPYKYKNSSAIKNFDLSTKSSNGENVFLGNFEFKNESFLQFFNLDREVDNICIKVNSNHGRFFYTSIYKIYALGH